MNSLLTITMIGTLTGIAGTGMGGLMALLWKNPGNKFMSIILGASGGLMLSVVTFDLLPEAFELGGIPTSILGMMIGIFMTALIDEMLPDFNNIAKGRGKYFKMGLLLAFGLALHNFPEGLAIGSGFTAGRNIGISLALVIGLHDIPEGMAVAAPMSMSGVNKIKIFIFTIATAIPTGIGAFVGGILGEISPVFVTLCLSFAGGTMLYIVCGDLIPKSRNLYEELLSTFGILFGIIIGIIITSMA
ncbi:zinc transporter ZupT [Oxobacter pfennigii]|uniref:Zinc transporter ZupT n=1 Tax=Oxobacter pfennigii TaxID=36849 RepID=A0A0P9AGP5_9CLOT|nr:ZIP family metal transporter [Oxobacter pfennigii]KPU44613.1 zinc transporter ZupT [Oxobacter pfennigii]